MNRWLASRREVLRGLGLGLGCLPLLRAGRAESASMPRRLICVVQPFGYRTAAWLPAGPGPLGAAALPDSTSPLTPYRDLLTFLPGLTNPGLSRCTSGCGGAYGATFGVARAVPGGYAESSIPTVDQVIGQGIARGTRLPLPTLPLGVLVDAGRGALTTGGRRCFWRDAGQPVDPWQDPHALYGYLFAGAADDEAARRLLLEKRSLLDHARGELDLYKKRLGTEDRQLVEQHEYSLREIEQTLAALPAPTCAPPALGAPIAVNRSNFAALAELQLKMAVAALRCDLTRVVTLQLASAAGSGISLDFVPGMPRTSDAEWARIARAPAAPDVDLKRLADKWFMGLFARLLAAMSAGPAGASLLDQSAVLWATTMNDGGDRNAQKLPWLLAGKCGGYFKTGRVADSAGKPLHGVLAQLCNALEVPVEFYGDKTFGAPMAGLEA